MTDSGLMVLFLTQTNSYLRPFNFCKSTVSNFTVHFQVRKKYRPVSFLFLPKYICVIFLCNNESFFDTFQYFFLTCLSFFQFQIMKSSLTPIGIHFCSDLCEEHLDWSFILSTTRGVCYDLVTVYSFYTVSLFSPHTLSM